MTPEVKKSIYDYIKSLLPDEIKRNLFWANERKTEPEKPYVMLYAPVPEQKTLPTAEEEIGDNVNRVTIYKNAPVTVCVFVEGVLKGKTNSLSTQNSYAENLARNLRNAFETIDSAYELHEEGLSCEVKSAMRNLTEPIDGGYNYRYEFDLVFGFNEVVTIKKLVGQDVKLNIKENK